MADTTITALPDAALPLSGAERVPMDKDGATVSAGSFSTGQGYRIATVGTTNFTAIGADSNTIGVVFVATGAGSGTGTAVTVTTVDAPASAIAATLPDATTSAAGKMSAAQVVKLNTIEEGATANTTEGIQDAAAALLTGGTHTGISFDYNDAGNRIDATVTAAGATDLSIANRGATTLDVASSTGADVTLPAATNTQSGLATAAQVAKLEGIASAATANASDAALRDRQTHTGEQAISTITGLATALTGKETAGAAAAAVTAHEAAADPHPGYLTPAEADAAYQPLDADLTSIAALTTTTFGRGHLALADAAAGTAQLNAFSTTLKGLVPAPGTATGKVLSDSGSWVVLGGGGDALVANPLSQFAATTSAQLRGVISDETGTGALVFADSPTLTLTNATGLPLATGISGLGSGIATALGVNVGSAGAPVLFGGAGGTPSSLTLTNATGLPTTGITAFNADARAQVEAALVAGSNITITPGSSGATRTLTIASTGSSGTKTLAHFTVRDNNPPATNFATLDTRNSVNVLEFDAATEESATFVDAIPEGANLASGLLVRIWWMGDTATSGNVRWAASLERGTTDLDADSFDTATEVTSAANGTAGILSVAEITCTTIDSLAAGDLFRLRIARKAADATNDTMTGDAQLVAVEVRQVA
jgi:hypothetical protein